MPAIDIALEVAQYLQSKGEGTVQTNLFVDSMPDLPDDCSVVYDFGGNNDTEPPEDSRELLIQVRTSGHESGYQKIWRMLNYILYPEGDFFQVGENLYHAELMGIPTIFDRDTSQRYLFTFQVSVQRVVTDEAADPWLEALSLWTETTLPGWTVYRTWPGNKRPSVTWKISTMEISEQGRGVFRVTKRLIGQIKGNAPNQQNNASLKLVEELANSIKLTLDAVQKRYLIISGLSASQPKEGSITAGQVNLTLSRLTNRPSEEAPLMAEVFSKGEVI